jgi:alpha-galactosidase
VPRALPALRLPRGALTIGALFVLTLAALAWPAGGGPRALALTNGQATTPPMGWNTWYSFGCNINAVLIKSMADAMHTNGMQAAGYTYVNLDDCWEASARDTNGNLTWDVARFGSDGIPGLATYVHNLGLKLGIYTDAGTATCQGYPGSLDPNPPDPTNRYKRDALTFAQWGVDFVKVDWCNTTGLVPEKQYPLFRDAIAAATTATGHPMVFSICEWGVNAPWTWGANTGNLWRISGDIADRWLGFLKVVDTDAPLYPSASPGAWNDPDMLQVGRGGMTATEDRSQFSLWAIMAAPLLASNDLTKMTTGSATATTLLNTEVIAVDQDLLGVQGRVVKQDPSGNLQVWAKPLQPGPNDPPGAAVRAVVVFNRMYNKKDMTVTWADIGLTNVTAVRDLWKHQPVTGYTMTGYTTTVIQHDVVVLRVVGQPKCPPGVWFC